MLYNLEKKFGKDQDMTKCTPKQLTIAKDYALQLSESEVKSASTKTNYLQNHGLTNINKPNRQRVIFNVAATYLGKFLNHSLIKGFDLLSSLIDVLMRFQEGQFAITGDIEAMIHQVKVLKEDTDSLRLLWYTN